MLLHSSCKPFDCFYTHLRNCWNSVIGRFLSLKICSIPLLSFYQVWWLKIKLQRMGWKVLYLLRFPIVSTILGAWIGFQLLSLSILRFYRATKNYNKAPNSAVQFLHRPLVASLLPSTSSQHTLRPSPNRIFPPFIQEQYTQSKCSRQKEMFSGDAAGTKYAL
jgi:hypothetical protein